MLVPGDLVSCNDQSIYDYDIVFEPSDSLFYTTLAKRSHPDRFTYEFLRGAVPLGRYNGAFGHFSEPTEFAENFQFVYVGNFVMQAPDIRYADYLQLPCVQRLSSLELAAPDEIADGDLVIIESNRDTHRYGELESGRITRRCGELIVDTASGAEALWDEYLSLREFPELPITVAVPATP